MRVLGKIDRDMIFDRALDRDHILAHREAGAVADAKDMRINRLRRIAKPHIQHDIRRLAPHSRQALQSCARLRNLAVKFINEALGQLDDILRLVAEKADGLDMLDHTGLAERQHFRGRIRHLEQTARGLVDALIGRLRRQRDGNHQRKRVRVL